MGTFITYLYELLSVFFDGVITIVSGIGRGFIKLFNFKEYLRIFDYYKNEFGIAGWILAILSCIVVVALLGLIIFLIYFLIRKYIRFRKTLIEQESMLEEISNLNKEVNNLVLEKEKILGMKAFEMGFDVNGQNENTTLDNSVMENEDEEAKKDDLEDVSMDNIRFTKLHQADIEYKDYKIKNYNNTFTLEELVETFRNFAASKLRLYYTSEMMRLFIAALASTKLIILQGISGTGKTSLAYAWGKFIKHDAIIASVQPSWRDRTELFGYFNEFTKKFNETDVLKGMYEAGYTDDVYVTVLDEMNIARVEYYFAEMLSILEMPSRSEWIIELVASKWDTDPKRITEGKLQIPGNMWYIGTINNDDSTFAVTDKVYDRAMPIDINTKGQIFEPIDTEAMDINSSYLEGLFAKAKQEHPMSQEIQDKINRMDDYVIQHFRIAFGNRIVKQMKEFVSVYVGCGGREVDGVDYFIARKILRKFEQLNLSYIRDEIDGYIKFLDKEFGKENFQECKEYLLRMKKMV